MKAKVILFLVFVGVALVLPKPVLSQEKNPEIQRGLQELKKKKGVSFNVKWHKDKNRVTTLDGKLSSPYPGTPEEAAKQFLKENAAIFQMPSDLSDVAIETMREDKIGDKHLGYYVSFKQTYKGLPIFGGSVGVILKSDRSVSTVYNVYLPNINILTTPALSENQVIDIAKDDHRKNCTYYPDKTWKPRPCEGEIIFKENTYIKLGILEYGGKPNLIYKINIGTESPVYDSLEYDIDANTGAIMSAGSLVVYFSGTGKVFDPNPVNTLNNTGLLDNRDKDDPIFNGAYFLKTLQDLSLNNGSYYLIGPYVDVTDKIENPYYFNNKSGYVLSASGNFNFIRAANEFEHVMVYYHIGTNQRYIQSLGFTNINNRSIKVDPHGLSGDDNSHYQVTSPNYPSGFGYLAFGEGGVDDAEDADVILHEYGHAIQDNQAPGKFVFNGSCSTEAGAMGEGFGDYWAASNNYTSFDPACIGEWNWVPGCLRRVDTTKHYPDGITGECHDDGEIWSAALWDMFNSLGKTTTDKLILKSHSIIGANNLLQNPTFCDGAKAIIQADQQLYAGANKNTITTVMINKGIGAQATKFVILDPTDSIPGTPATVTIQTQNCFDAVVTGYQNDVTFVLSGSATGGGLVDVVNGVGTIQINDTVAETVTLSLVDTQSTGLDVSSTQDVIFCGEVISISGPDAPTDGSQYTVIGGTSPYTWTITKGSITQDGIVTVSGQCGVETITVTGACGTASKDVRMPSGVWVVSYTTPTACPGLSVAPSNYPPSNPDPNWWVGVTYCLVYPDAVTQIRYFFWFNCGAAVIPYTDACIPGYIPPCEGDGSVVCDENDYCYLSWEGCGTYDGPLVLYSYRTRTYIWSCP